MRIEGEVTRVDGAVAADERGIALINWPCHGLHPAPKYAVMHDQEINPTLNRLLKGNAAGINRRPDFSYSAIVGDLQAIVRTGEIFESHPPGAFVTIIDELFERSHGPAWGASRPRASRRCRHRCSPLPVAR